MRDYAQSRSTFWTGQTGRAMRGDPELQVTAHYLFTSLHSTMTGIYHLPLIYIAHETGLSLQTVERAMERLQGLDYCLYDPDTEYVWVKEMARFQIADELKANDNRIKSVVAEYRKMPPGALREGFFSRYGIAFRLDEAPAPKSTNKPPPTPSKPLTSPFEAPSEGSTNSAKPLRSQEQEQEQEQDKAAHGSTLSPVQLGCPSQVEVRSAKPLARAELDEVEAACRDALGEAAPADPVIGPMALLIQDGIRLDRMTLILRSEARRPRQKPIRTWGIWAKIVQERHADGSAPASSDKPAHPPDDSPRLQFPGGFSATENSLITCQRRGLWADEWGPKPGKPGCLVPERLWVTEAQIH